MFEIKMQLWKRIYNLVINRKEIFISNNDITLLNYKKTATAKKLF